MSLIRRQTTPAMVEANRANSLRSTGPLTDMGKINARLNSIKHGITARAEGLALPELGENSEALRQMHNQLRACFHPHDHFELLLLDQIVENRWRRRRVVRAEANILAAQGLNFELEYARKLAGDGRSPEAMGEARVAAAAGLAALPDSSAKFNLILQCLRAAEEALAREGFGDEGLKRLEAVYGPDPGLAGAVLLASYHQHQQLAARKAKNAAQSTSARQTFLELLTAEIACFEKLLELHETAARAMAATSALAQSALSTADSQRITRYEAFLDRQFERLVKQFNEWHDSHPQDGAYLYRADEREDAGTLAEKLRAAAIARDKALTGAIKEACGKDLAGRSSSEARAARGRPKEKRYQRSELGVPISTSAGSHDEITTKITGKSSKITKRSRQLQENKG